VNEEEISLCSSIFELLEFHRRFPGVVLVIRRVESAVWRWSGIRQQCHVIGPYPRIELFFLQSSSLPQTLLAFIRIWRLVVCI
jgi:hypothetical protein